MTDQRFEGKTILITGAAAGFGRDCAARLMSEGANIAVIDVDRETAAATASELNAASPNGNHALSIEADVTDPSAVEEAVDAAIREFGRLDGAVNNAGMPPRRLDKVADTTLEDWDAVLDLNLRGVYLCCRKELAHMAEIGGGAIVNVASIGALQVSSAGTSPYNTSKHAVIGLTKSCARDYADQHIRVNAICPGSMVTAMTEHMRELSPETYKHTTNRIPFGRFARTSEVTGAVSFLLSDDAAWVTGHALVADGGTIL